MGRRVLRGEPGTLAWIALALLLIGAGVFLYAETRAATFWFDEWGWVLHRRGSDLDAFLEPHNGHLSLVPVVAYRILLAIFGLDVYGPYRLMAITGHLAVVALVFAYARPRVGGPMAVLAAALLLFLGPAWNNFLWPFQLGWLISLGAALGAFLMLDRGDRLGDTCAAVLLALSLASSGLGLPVALGMAVDVLWGRRRWRDAWIVGAPLALYGVWWLAYQDSPLEGRLVDVPGEIADSAAAAVGALLGFGAEAVPGQSGSLLEWGRPLAVLALVLFVWRVVRLGRIPPRVLAFLAILVSFWAATELSRGWLSNPDESRYLYVGGLFVVLIAVELARGVSVSWRAAAVVTAVALAAMVSNIAILRDAGAFVRQQGEVTRAVLGAVELSRPSVRPGYVIAGIPGYPLVTVDARSYFDVAAEDGTPASNLSELATGPAYARGAADRELIRIRGTDLQRTRAEASPGGAGPAVDAASGGTVARRDGCVGLRATGARPAVLQATVPADGVRLTAQGGPARVGVRRFGDSFEPIGRVAPSAPVVLRLPGDRAPQPWHVQVEAAERASVCGLG
jgi:hypothetical protein